MTVFLVIWSLVHLFLPTYLTMIKDFKNKRLAAFFREGNNKGIPKEFEKRIRVRLEALDSASCLDDLKIPGYNLHELKGDRKETWSIALSGNWRITFKFEQGKGEAFGQNTFLFVS
ncbi:type II toxin-antitoxin system RelE/ParE family toxin [Planktothricoides raciborskii]|uniref:Type II toxin-antitoxin system RelE/ParE family toxin n=2 Tax=Planktothricoides raciborskii TaxID=132608 RepID=A0AAU8J6Z6_9CYAN|nr:type II toxin-antitoxin system RelE/ParE family toxin [Planktothricoides raciborskii]